MRLVFLFVLLTVAQACGDDKDAKTTAEPDDSELYRKDQLLEVEIELSERDWDTIRVEGRSINDVLAGCIERDYPYTKVPAKVRINGRTFDKAAVRKKGFLGSLSSSKPSLRIDLGEYDKEQSFNGVQDIVLNNSRQDLSYTHQCMAFDAFRAAGVPAPRCAHASVTVNGKKLGTYVHVEALKKAFLARELGEDAGDLYEGSANVDFRRDMLAGFEKKTNEDKPQSKQLSALAKALESEGAEMLAGVEQLVDLDGFMLFWATEVLIAHWDGYSGDLNNFYVYVSDKDKKLTFMPWGTDGAFDRNHAFLPFEGRPQSVFAQGRLARRLYEYPKSRDRYAKTLRALLEQVWDERAQLKEVDRIAKLLGDEADPDALDAQRAFIRSRRAELLKELDGAAPVWPYPEGGLTQCVEERNTPISGTFKALWGDIDTLGASDYDPANSLSVVIEGKTVKPEFVVTKAGIAMDPTYTGNAVRLAGTLADGSLVVVQLSLGPAGVAPGEVRFQGFDTTGAVLYGASAASLALVGLIGDGRIVLDEAAAKDGAPVTGRFSGRVVQLSAQPGVFGP